MSTSPFTPLTLNGVSQYSSDLQSVLNRAVQIAQIPVQALQNKDSDILQEKTLLGNLQSSVAALATSLGSLGKVAASEALGASSSDPNIVSVSNTGATSPASYTINSITSIATAAIEHSLTSYADSSSTPVSTTGTMQLVVGSTPYTFTLTHYNLVSLRDQINSLGAGVTAWILTTSGGNYLSISANTGGATTLQLIDDPITPNNPSGANMQWLTSTNQGTDAVFKLINVSQPSNVINSLIPVVTFTILPQSSTPVTLSLTSDPNQLSAALQDFVTNYNQLRSTLSQQ